MVKIILKALQLNITVEILLRYSTTDLNELLAASSWHNKQADENGSLRDGNQQYKGPQDMVNPRKAVVRDFQYSSCRFGSKQNLI